MPDAQPSAQPTLDHLLHTVEQLPTEELTEFVRRVIAIQALRGVPLLTDDDEQALVESIAGRLPPDTQRRLDELREKSREGVLSVSEHAELLSFVQQVEQRDVVHAEALIRLAQKRGVMISDLLREFGISEDA